MPYADNDGVRLHWESQGTGSPVLLVMGATFSSAMWYPVAPVLAQQHRVITFDNRGTGDSSGTRTARMSDFTADARAVMDAAGVDAAHVYGVSLGGVIALQLALESPERVRSLVLGCTGILDAAKPRAPKLLALLLVRLPRRLKLGLTAKRLYGPACPPELAAADLARFRTDRADPQGLMAQQDALRNYSVSVEEVATLTMPALVLHGSADVVVKPAWGEELAATLPDARLITYPGAGHSYMLSADDQPNTDVLEFLASVG